MPGFRLGQLVERYLTLLSPLSESYEVDPQTGIRTKVLVTVVKRYQNLTKMLEGKSTAVAKHRKELFGSSPSMETGELYNLLSVAKEMNIPYPQFVAYELRDQALMIAHFYLKNIVETLQRHDDIIARNEDAVRTKAKGKT